MAPPFEGIGASVRRNEDLRFISGHGHYTDDINRPGQLYAYIRRSDRPHARIASMDTAAAKSAPGVVAVYTSADLAAIGGLPCGWLIHNKDGSPMSEPKHPVLAEGKVRHVGDPIAVVIAETRQQAKDAAELLNIDLQDLPAVASVTDAVKPGASLVHDDVAGNICYDWHLGDKAAVDAAFAKAAQVVKLDLTNNRLIPNAMEPRAAIGDFDPTTGEHTLYTTSQNPHVIRLLMGAFVLQIPEHKLRVVAPDVGGGFGSKIYHYAEEAIVTWAAAQLKRPVKWTAERSESFVSDAHGRDHVTTRRTGARRAGQLPGAEDQHARQHGRLSLDVRDLDPDLPARDAARRRVQDAGDLCRGEGHLHQHRAGRRLSRRRAAGGDVPAGTAGRCGGARYGHRSDRDAAAQLHSRQCLPLPDAGRAAVRQRQLRGDARDRAEERRLGRVSGAARRGREARQAARHRRVHLSRSLRHRTVGSRRCPRRARRPLRGRQHPRQPDRQRHGAHRHAQPRPGPRDDVRAACRRHARHSVCQHRGRARRHCENPVRHGHLRQPQPRRRRIGAGQGDGQGDRQGQEDRRPPAGSLGGRHRVQGRQVHASAAPTNPRRSARSR